MKPIEHIITLVKGSSKESILGELSRDTGADNSVNSNEIPDRPISISEEQAKPGSQRVFRLNLYPEELSILKNNPNVMAIEGKRPSWSDDWQDAQSLTHKRYPIGKSPSTTELDNWGLARHSSKTSIWTTGSFGFGHSWNSTDQIQTGWANTANAGLGVDLIMQEGGIFAHTLDEFTTPGGGGFAALPRFNQFQWNTLNNCSHVATQDYSSSRFAGHATHCAGIAAGKRYGWAKYANLYSVDVDQVGYDNCFDVIKEFHLHKIRTQAIPRPTIVSASWGQKIYTTAISRFEFRSKSFTDVFHLDGIPVGPVGKFGLSGQQRYSTAISNSPGNGGLLNRINYWSESVHAETEEMTDVGVHYIKSAGNQHQKLDIPTGEDFHNYITLTRPTSYDGRESYDYNAIYGPAGYPVFINRGAGNISNTTIVVGSIEAWYGKDSTNKYRTNNQFNTTNNEIRAASSEHGPRVDIYAAGGQIYSPYYNSGTPVRLSGTSMAAPQIAGMVACLASKYPNTTPGQMRTFVIANSNFHSSNNLFDDSATPIPNTSITVLGDPAHFKEEIGTGPEGITFTLGNNHHLRTDGHSTGNIAYLDANLPYDPSEQAVINPGGLGSTYLDYDNNTNAVYYLLVNDVTRLNYTLAANATVSRVGLANNANYRYYKFVGYEDLGRTILSQGEIYDIRMTNKLGGHSLFGDVFPKAGAQHGIWYDGYPTTLVENINNDGVIFGQRITDGHKSEPIIIGINGAGYGPDPDWDGLGFEPHGNVWEDWQADFSPNPVYQYYQNNSNKTAQTVFTAYDNANGWTYVSASHQDALNYFNPNTTPSGWYAVEGGGQNGSSIFVGSANTPLIPTQGMLSSTFMVQDPNDGAFWPVKLSSDFNRTYEGSFTGGEPKEYQRMTHTGVFDTGWEGAHPLTRANPSYDSGWPTTTDHRYVPRSGTSTELHVDLGREVMVNSISITIPDNHRSPVPGYFDIYGSHTQFSGTLGLKTEGEKIGEFNRADIFLTTRDFSDPSTQPLATDSFPEKRAKEYRTVIENRLEGINQTPISSPTDPPITYGTWDPETSETGWYLVPPSAYESIVQLGQTTAGNATIANTTQTNF